MKRLLTFALGLLLLPAAAVALQPASPSAGLPEQAKDPGYGGPGNECEVAEGAEPKMECLRPGDSYGRGPGVPREEAPWQTVGGYVGTRQQSLIRVGACPALTITKRHALAATHCIEGIGGVTWTGDDGTKGDTPVVFMSSATGSLTRMTYSLDLKRIEPIKNQSVDCNRIGQDLTLIEFSGNLSAYTRARIYESGHDYGSIGDIPHLDATSWAGAIPATPTNYDTKEQINASIDLTLGGGAPEVHREAVDDGYCSYGSDSQAPYFEYSTSWPSSGPCWENGESSGVISWGESTYRLSYGLIGWGGDLDNDGDCDIVSGNRKGGGVLIRRRSGWFDTEASNMGVGISSSLYSFSSSIRSGATLYYKLWSVD